MRRTSTIDNILLVFIGVIAIPLAVPMVGFAMTLDPSTDVVPRIFSPNGDGVNDLVFFKVDNPRQTQVAGVIFDMTGAQVSSLLPAPNNLPTADSLYWNGRDENGSIVPPGPYLYRIDGDGSVISGVVVVAR